MYVCMYIYVEPASTPLALWPLYQSVVTVTDYTRTGELAGTHALV